MPSSSKLHILVIEDNAGDFLLIEDYLNEAFDNPTIINATTLAKAKQIISQTAEVNIILLDLSLPDASGDKLVKQIVASAGAIPIVVLTGFDDKDFGVKSLYLGISDYLYKGELNPTHLRKSILYSLERELIRSKLTQSEENYRKLFDLGPSPQWVFDTETLQFMDVNKAAVEHYGFSREEFLSMKLYDIRPTEDLPLLREAAEHVHEQNFTDRLVIRHLKKNGELIYVNIRRNPIIFNNRQAQLASILDITKNINTENALKASEQRFKALVQEGADLITIMDNTGKYLYVSPSTKTIWGLDPEVFIGKNVFDFVHADDIEQIIKNFKTLSEQKRIEIAPFRFKGKGNEYRWIETVLTDLTDDPAVGGIVSNSKDITRRIQIEKEMAESIKRYDNVSKATSDVIYEWDMVTDSVFWNHGLKEIFGYDTGHYSDTNFWQVNIHPDDRDKVTTNLTAQIKRKSLKVQSEYRFKVGNGSYKCVLDRGFIIYDDEGIAVKMIGAMQDITDQTNYIKQIEEQNSKLSEIAWMQSHLVRNPLCNVMSLSQLLDLDQNDKSENQEILKKLTASAHELDQIIKSILLKIDGINDQD